MSKEAMPPPNYTQTPNVFFDDLLPKITSLCELKVTLAIARQTFGWRKSEDQISVTQLVQLTGLSRKGAQDGLTLALKRGFVTRRADGQAYFYSLKVCNDIAQSPTATMQPSSIEPCNSVAQSDPPAMQPSSTELCNDIAQELCNDLAPQKKEEKERKKTTKSTAPNGAGGTRIPDDFVVTPKMAQWAAENVPLVDLAKETEAFRDYWRGVPGARGKKLDWPGTWRNRMRDRQDYRSRTVGGKKVSGYESASERNVRLIGESLGDETGDNSLAPRQLSSSPDAGRT